MRHIQGSLAPRVWLRRLDYLPVWGALLLGGSAGALLAAVVLSWASPAVGCGLFLGLLGLAVALAYSGEPITVLAAPGEREAVERQAEPVVEREKPPETEAAALQMELIRVPGGVFRMGSPEDERGRLRSEGPVHNVEIAAFQMMSTLVTRRLYWTMMEPEQSRAGNDERPVTNVTWFDAIQFCNRLSERDGLAPCYHIESATRVTWDERADGYRLPTEAEWEYACRAGTQSRWSFGDDKQELTRYAWYDDNTRGTTHPVGQKAPNPWGLYDMHGNVWEWCWDWYGPYLEGRQLNPTGPTEGNSRVRRGGSAWNDAWYLRSANRFRYQPEFRFDDFGFRCVRRPRR